jgi:hypothetical protein
MHGRYEKIIQIIVAKPERKRSICKPRPRWEMTLKLVLEGVD